MEYLIDNDGFKFQELDFEIDDFIDYLPEDWNDIEIHDFSKNNLAFADHWKLLRTGFSEIEGEENLMPDISRWIGASLVLSPKAHRLLGELLAQCGELLPVDVLDDSTGKSELYHIFNCLTNDSSQPAYKSKADEFTRLRCGEKFKNLVEDFELKGIVFK